MLTKTRVMVRKVLCHELVSTMTMTLVKLNTMITKIKLTINFGPST